MTCHSLFGLTVRSPWPLDAPLVDDVSEPDVEIRLGEVPEHLDQGERYNPLGWSAPGRLLLNLPGIARFLVSDGREIRVAPDPVADAATLALFAIASPLAGILHQRRRLCLHASGVAFDAGVLLFVAESGTGKSTLAAALLARGHEMVTDDMAAIECSNERWTMSPGPSRLKLWPDSLAALDIDPTPLASVRTGLDKKFVPVPSTGSGARPIAAIVALETHAGDAIDVERLPLRRAVAMLMHHTYRRRMQAAIDGTPGNFARVAPLADAVPCFTIRRSTRRFALIELADAVEALADGLGA